jgi:hypothetical protein
MSPRFLRDSSNTKVIRNVDTRRMEPCPAINRAGYLPPDPVYRREP